MEFRWDKNNLSMEEIRALVDLGDNPTELELQSIGLFMDGEQVSIVDMELFKMAVKERELRFTSKDIFKLSSRIRGKEGDGIDEKR